MVLSVVSLKTFLEKNILEEGKSHLGGAPCSPLAERQNSSMSRLTDELLALLLLVPEDQIAGYAIIRELDFY